MTDERFHAIGRLLREPAVHFLLLGAGLFALFAWVRTDQDPMTIEITGEVVESLRHDHARRTGRPPSRAEEQALVAQVVDDEVLFREALALGLDRGDPIIRRRLIQKMRFLTEDLTPLPDPSDGELEAYLAEHADRYFLPEQLAIEHVFVSRADGDDLANERAQRLLDELLAGADSAGLGDPFMHGYTFSERSATALDARFGPGFSASLAAAPSAVWFGPVGSSYGLHLVRITSRRPARLPALAEVAGDVSRDWLEEQRERANREAIDELRARYDIVVESSADLPSSSLGAASLVER